MEGRNATVRKRVSRLAFDTFVHTRVSAFFINQQS